MEALGDYAKQAAPDLLLVKRSSHPTQLVDLFGARSSPLLRRTRAVGWGGLVKQLTGRDPIRARRMQPNVRSKECPAPQ